MIIMDKLIEKLNNPFDGLTKNDIPQIQKRCQEIAELLFKGYGIKCGKRIFQFAEIEFYYYKKEVDDIHNFDAPWNKETYPRQKNAGDFFFHYSGVDICFQCNFEEKEKWMNMVNMVVSLLGASMKVTRFLQVLCFA